MTFTIYDKHPHADAYRVGAGYTMYAIIGVEKRFTDSELAAEFHNAARDEDMHWVQTGEEEGPIADIAATFLSFAIRPNYDEVT